MRGVLLAFVTALLLPAAVLAQPEPAPAGAPASASAPEPASHERGTIVLTDANRASAAFHVYDSRAGLRGYAFVLAPTVDVFLNRMITVGGALEIAYENYQALHSFSIGGDVRGGVYGVLGKRWAIWPTLALGVAHGSLSVNGPGFVDKGSSVSLRARLEAPVLFYPTPGFFVGAGPLLGVTGAAQQGDFHGYVSFGLLTTLGGTF